METLDLDQDTPYCFVWCMAVEEGQLWWTRISEASFLVRGLLIGNCDVFKAANSALSNKANIADLLSMQAANEKKAHGYFLNTDRGDGPAEEDSNFH